MRQDIGHRINKAVFLDRDGVLNRPQVIEGKSFPPSKVEDFELIDGVFEACKRLAEAGYLLIVVTNQPDVRTGKQELSVVEAMHEKLFNWLPIDDVYVCYHIGEDMCKCRKPKPGLIYEAAEKYFVDLAGSYIVGDRWRDIEAGQEAGCTSYFIDYGYDEKQPEGQFLRVSDLHEAADRILS